MEWKFLIGVTCGVVFMLMILVTLQEIRIQRLQSFLEKLLSNDREERRRRVVPSSARKMPSNSSL